MDKIKTFLVEKDDSKVRLDKYLAYKLKNFTRTHIKRIILSENVHINDKIIPFPSQKLRIGDQIKLSIIENKKEHIKSQKIKIDIVYEDKDLIIVNKPSGMVVHPGAGNKDGTLVNGLLHLYNENLSNINGSSRPGIVHRIDKDTSGLIVVAKNNFSHAKLSEQFSRHTIKRKYIALIWGVVRPLNGRVTTLLSRNKKNRQLMSVSEVRGKKAITNYKTLKVYSSKEIPKISLVECLLETGRTHQIRVHLSYKGNGLVGDKKYGKKKLKFRKINKSFEKILLNFKRQALHAKELGFIHPTKNTEMKFNSKLPLDFKKMLDLLEKFSN
ncbi:MAG: RNA pseudouridine synthase [Candidatus Pelagibacter sp.]|nr:RNA pseudouridine synthase [Candidatus Pelagibacter sp.]|tara:strand:+ start:3260 stop:4240 length:981 start_codon:yes stop_codon:yes gene_type:complete